MLSDVIKIEWNLFQLQSEVGFEHFVTALASLQFETLLKIPFAAKFRTSCSRRGGYAPRTPISSRPLARPPEMASFSENGLKTRFFTNGLHVEDGEVIGP